MKRHSGLLESVRSRMTRASRRAKRGAWGLWVWSNEATPCQRRIRVRAGGKHGRRGSTLLVVMALLGMLLLLGMMYFTFATQEQHNATNFSEAAKKIDDPVDDIEAIFDSVLEQVVQGPTYDRKMSALWGGRNSMAYGMVGHDLQPFNGVGVRMHVLSSGQLVVDQDRDGNADPDQSLMQLNNSPAARETWPPTEQRVETFPAPDVAYTYPDHTSPYLAYIGTTWKTPSGVAATGYPVIKPSFHRPEFLRDNNGIPITDWATHTSGGAAPFSTAGRLFRPHPNHVYVPRADQTNITGPIRRFLDDYNPLDAGDIASLAPFFAPNAPRGFPFKNVPPLPAPVPGSAPDRRQGIWSLSGLPPGAPAPFPAHEFDVDNDNDGVTDSIWMDLDLPIMVRTSDNATYIPLVALLIQDLDSLLNLNAVGNLSGDTRTASTSNFGNGGDISRSSMGLSPSEINPEWALDTLPSEAASLSDHTSYFHAPTTYRQLANMEWWWFNKGRVEYTTSLIHAGRYGEADRIRAVLNAGGPAIGVQNSQSNLFPFPGKWDKDDNRDGNEGGAIVPGSNVGGQALPIGHPLAINGMGRYWQAANPKQLELFQALGVTVPNQWLRYFDMGIGYDGNTAAGNVAWVNPFGGALMVNPLVGAGFAVPGGSAPILVDDPNEMTLIPKYLQRPDDEPLDAKETLLLFMNPSDRSRTGITSRVQDLMPGNITPASGSTAYQLQVAKRFTTESWDTKQFALPRFIGGVGADLQPGVAGIDDNRDGNVDDQNERGWPGSDDDRAWEYSVDVNQNGLLEFPPQFNPVMPSEATDRHLAFAPAIVPPAVDPNVTIYRPENAYGPLDPFRPQLRRLLTVEYGNTAMPRTPMRLGINELLDIEHRNGAVSNPYTDPLAYRPLTAHSTDSTLATLPSQNGPDNRPGIAGTDDNNDGTVDDPGEFGAFGSDDPQFPPTTEAEKEFYARRDRQQMARDIYVLLYTFCGGNDRADFSDLTKPSGDVTKVRGVLDPTDPANASTPYVYHGKTCRQMAQFAVNMVDAMDRDNVTTAFEYDDNLADGWNLDDDFTTNDGANAATGLLPSGTSRRFVVYGVEAQELTISEALWAFQPQNATDATRTPFNETTGKHHFLQVELRSISPNGVDLYDAASTAVNRAIWRIHRDDNDNGVMDGPENAAQILKGTFVAVAQGPAAAPPSSLSPGSLFTFASADASSVGAASLYVDTNATPDFELAAPNLAGSLPTTPAFADLDMNHSSHTSFVALEQAGSVTGDLLSRNYEPTVTETTLRLERRLNPKLIRLNLAANPFHSVDQFKVQRQTLGIVDADDAMAASAKVAAVRSQERRQPLNSVSVANSTGAAPTVLKSTLTLKNSNSPATFDLFQPHFDRDFASVIELFDIPLEGPEQLTKTLIDSHLPPNRVDNGGTEVGQLSKGGPFTFGAAVLLQSEDTDANAATFRASDDANNNGFQDVGVEGDTNGNGAFDFGEDFNKNGDSDSHPNHFHRLLSLVEVPTRTHRQLGDPLKVNLVAGKINLNGIRDPRVLAALIDDRSVLGSPERTGVDLDSDGKIEPGLQDLLGDTVEDSTGTAVQRDWWFQFLVARDGLDPTTTLPLPISGFSRPFHDVGYLRYDEEFRAQASIEDTILRELPGAVKYVGGMGKSKGKGKAWGKTNGGGKGAAGPSDGRRLFELATDTEYEQGSVEPMLRHRLLSKIIGNTTTRSNVFVVQATIGMFACKELSNGAVRIGGQMDVNRDNTPDSYRAIFIIDRSAIEEAYDKGSRTFDWKKLVKARQRIE